jgi:hypothetical protein
VPVAKARDTASLPPFRGGDIRRFYKNHGIFTSGVVSFYRGVESLKRKMAEDNKAIEEGNLEHHRDPALDPANEHHHAHHNHTALAEKGREDEVVYTQGTTFEKSAIPDASPQDHSSLQEKDQGNTDIEDLSEGYAKRPWQRHVLKQWRHVAYAVVWLLFTG